MKQLQNVTPWEKEWNLISYSLKQGLYPAQFFIIQLWINRASTQRAPPLAKETQWVTIRDSLPLSTKYGQEEHSPFRKECREPSGAVRKYKCSSRAPHVFLLSHFTLTLQGNYHNDATENVWHFLDQSSAQHFKPIGTTRVTSSIVPPWQFPSRLQEGLVICQRLSQTSVVQLKLMFLLLTLNLLYALGGKNVNYACRPCKV